MNITVAGTAYGCSGATVGRGDTLTMSGPLWDDIVLHDVSHIDGEPTGVRGGEVVIHFKGGSYEFRQIPEEDE